MNSRMTIKHCQNLAKKLGFDSATFLLCGPKDKLQAKWLDAYYGLFELTDPKVTKDNGFLAVQDFEDDPDVWCEDLKSAETV